MMNRLGSFRVVGRSRAHRDADCDLVAHVDGIVGVCRRYGRESFVHESTPACSKSVGSRLTEGLHLYGMALSQWG